MNKADSKRGRPKDSHTISWHIREINFSKLIVSFRLHRFNSNFPDNGEHAENVIHLEEIEMHSVRCNASHLFISSEFISWNIGSLISGSE
jgi:hypothetical protein